MNILPIELIDYIILNLYNLSPQNIYHLRKVNKTFKICIDNIKNNNYKKYNYENILNNLAHKGLYCNFKWLFNNNINVSINNINNFIINNRIDIIRLLIKYKYLHNLLFNRFNIFNYKNELDILSLTESENPLVSAGTYKGNLEIVKILLNENIKNNPYVNQIPGLFEICIKHNNIVVVDYLIKNYYSNIEHHIHKINNLILKSNSDLSDLIYYLLIYCNYSISDIFLINLIKKHYTDIFKYCIDNYQINRINLDKDFINIGLLNNLNYQFIIYLIELNFKITIKDIEIALKNKNIYLVEQLSRKFNNT